LQSDKPIFSVGLDYGSFAYGENGMSDNANLTGVDAKVFYPVESSSIVLAADLEYLTGGGTYNGSNWGGNPVSSSTTNQMGNLRGTFGIRQFYGDSNNIIYFSGIGLRQLVNNQSGVGSYERDISYTYVPVGLEWGNQITPKMQIAVSADYDFLLEGTVISHFSDVNPSLPDITNHQSNGYGDRIALKGTYQFENYGVSLQIYQQYWNVLQSDQQPLAGNVAVVEPDNNSRLTGAILSIMF
jgi:hypothetical protein